MIGDYLLDRNGNPAICKNCGKCITRREGDNRTGYNFNIKFFCDKCLKQLQPPPKSK